MEGETSFFYCCKPVCMGTWLGLGHSEHGHLKNARARAPALPGAVHSHLALSFLSLLSFASGHCGWCWLCHLFCWSFSVSFIACVLLC